jgi:hypothetical protein
MALPKSERARAWRQPTPSHKRQTFASERETETDVRERVRKGALCVRQSPASPKRSTEKATPAKRARARAPISRELRSPRAKRVIRSSARQHSQDPHRSRPKRICKGTKREERNAVGGAILREVDQSRLRSGRSAQKRADLGFESQWSSSGAEQSSVGRKKRPKFRWCDKWRCNSDDRRCAGARFVSREE